MRKEPDVQVAVIDGNRGELTVSVDGRVVAEKAGDDLPPVEEVLAAVRAAEPTAAET